MNYIIDYDELAQFNNRLKQNRNFNQLPFKTISKTASDGSILFKDGTSCNLTQLTGGIFNSQLYVTNVSALRNVISVFNRKRVSSVNKDTDITKLLKSLESKYEWFKDSIENNYRYISNCIEVKQVNNSYEFIRDSDSSTIRNIKEECKDIDKVYKLGKRLESKSKLRKFNLGIYVSEDSVTLFLFANDDCGSVFLNYNRKLDRYDLEASDITAKDLELLLKQVGLDYLVIGVPMNRDTMVANIDNASVGRKLNKSKSSKLLTNQELRNKYTKVQLGTGTFDQLGWHKGVVNLSKKYATLGYTICINGKIVNDAETEVNKILHDSGSTTVKYFSYVGDYVDTSNNVYYIGLGKVLIADLYC